MQAGTVVGSVVAPLGFTLFFVAAWCLACYAVGMISGWLALSHRFKKQSEPYGDMKTAGPFSYAVYMRYWCHYSGVVRLSAAADALFISVLLPFRPGHPSLSIPWSEIQLGRTKCFWRNYAVLTMGREEKIPMRISWRMARNLGLLDRVSA